MSDEARRIEALHRLELLDTPDDADYDRIVHLASTMLDAPIALINLIDVDRQWSKARVGTELKCSATLTFRQIPFPDPSLRVHMDAMANKIGFPMQALIHD